MKKSDELNLLLDKDRISLLEMKLLRLSYYPQKANNIELGEIALELIATYNIADNIKKGDYKKDEKEYASMILKKIKDMEAKLAKMYMLSNITRKTQPHIKLKFYLPNSSNYQKIIR